MEMVFTLDNGNAMNVELEIAQDERGNLHLQVGMTCDNGKEIIITQIAAIRLNPKVQQFLYDGLISHSVGSTHLNQKE